MEGEKVESEKVERRIEKAEDDLKKAQNDENKELELEIRKNLTSLFEEKNDLRRG